MSDLLSLSRSMSLKLNTPILAPSLFANSNQPSEIRFSNRWGQRKVVERSLSHSLALLDHQSCRRRRDHIRCCGMAGGVGGDHHHHVLHTAVWWDLNTCPVPDGVDPRCVRPCIESALEKQFGRRTAVTIYAIGNLEYISSDLLQNISSSGIILTHSLYGVHDLVEFLDDWSDDELKKPHYPGYIMVISADYNMLHPQRFLRYGFTTSVVVAYPKRARLSVPLHQLKVFAQDFGKAFAKYFVWGTLLSDNLGEKTLSLRDEKPLCICNICDDVYHACDEFITHLKSEEHRNQLLEIDHYGEPKHFCQVCSYLTYGKYNLILHYKSEEHNRKLVEKQAQEEEDCERSGKTTNPELDLFYKRNKKQSL